MEHKNYFTVLPDNYKEDYSIDAKNAKTVIILNVAATAVAAAIIAAFFTIARSMGLFDTDRNFIIPLLIYIAGSVAFIIVHELLHGLAYKILTGAKLTFGITVGAAFCGVPSLYVKKKASLIAMLTPFAVLNSALGIPLFFIKDPVAFMVIALLFATHFAGCVGDVYGALLIAFRYRGKDVVINDTGPKQTYYLPADQTK